MFSPVPADLEWAGVKAEAGAAHASRQPQNNATACTAAREGVSLVIEGTTPRKESPPVIGGGA